MGEPHGCTGMGRAPWIIMLGVIVAWTLVLVVGISLGGRGKTARGVPHAPVSTPAPPATAIPNASHTTSDPVRSTIFRATLAQVARDFGIHGQLDCRVVESTVTVPPHQVQQP